MIQVALEDIVTRKASRWNPRYEQYCRVMHAGAHPEVVLQRDRANWQGGCMAGFILWVSACWVDFAKVRPEMNPSAKTEADHAAFDAWLAALPCVLQKGPP